MNRNYKLDKETTQRLLDLAVEDNLIKLHKKVGTKGNKAGVEEDAFRLPTDDMLPYERHDWYCFHCHCKFFLMMMMIFTEIFLSRRRGCDVSRLSPRVSSGVHQAGPDRPDQRVHLRLLQILPEHPCRVHQG